MKRSSYYSLIVIVSFFIFSCGTGNRNMTQSVTGTSPAGDTLRVYHDTINKKAEIRHTGPDQRITDSIKDDKTRKKK